MRSIGSKDKQQNEFIDLLVRMAKRDEESKFFNLG